MTENDIMCAMSAIKIVYCCTYLDVDHIFQCIMWIYSFYTSQSNISRYTRYYISVSDTSSLKLILHQAFYMRDMVTRDYSCCYEPLKLTRNSFSNLRPFLSGQLY